ncbi:hypothetical protein SO802_025185 [Lithocarpus litseifolius]|uniref:DUF7910 domain-containing protein n=1 Tax=Lithocarpus litseifolius TaxID=425828 RepID=A0AAW2BVZ5_9ROSI
MAHHFHLTIHLVLCLSCVVTLSLAQSSNLPFKAVNLGCWLVTEGWMKPSLFQGIPNKDLLDGTQVQLMSTKLQKYLSAESGGGTIVVANRTSASGWETFRLWRVDETTFNFRVFNKQFAGLKGYRNRIVAAATAPGNSETFQIIRKEGDPNRIPKKASNGKFLQDHWNTYITDEDFRFMSSNGLTAVRIPVGWWIALDPTPPKPIVGGSLKALDNAFKWAQKYGMKVIVDLHAVQGSQNGNDHSGTRDGFQEWGDSNIKDTVAVRFPSKKTLFLCKYANNPSLAAIELVNEPLAPGVTLDNLKNYYKSGYDAVRKYTPSAYVILSNRLGNADPTELLSFAGNFNHVVIDRASSLKTVTTSNGPLSFVGEWTAEFARNGASMQDYQNFAKAQLDVYGLATFGWAYWAYKCQYEHWSLKWMIENNYIKL